MPATTSGVPNHAFGFPSIKLSDSTDAPGFVLPLSREEFAAALRSGHGRVFLHARQCGLEGMDDLLLGALLEEPEHQECGGRESWIWELLKLSHGREEILESAYARLAKVGGSDGDTGKLFTIAMLGALEGRSDYAALMREVFAREHGLDAWSGVSEIKRVFGAKGVAFILECWRRRTQERPSFKADTNSLAFLFEGFDRQELIEAFLERVPHSPFLADYVRWFEKGWEPQRRIPSPPPVLEKEDFFPWIERVLASGKPMSNWSEAVRLARHADDDHARTVFERLLVEKDQRVVLCLLRYFSARPIPRYDPMIGELALGTDQTMAWAAIRALELIEAPEIRELIREACRRPPSETAAESIRFFRRNFRPGDAELIMGLMPEEADGEDHFTIMQVREVFESNPVAELAPLAIWAYNATFCGHCREAIVKSLHDCGRVRDWLLEEAFWDADSMVRELASKLTGRPAAIPIESE